MPIKPQPTRILSKLNSTSPPVEATKLTPLNKSRKISASPHHGLPALPDSPSVLPDPYSLSTELSDEDLLAQLDVFSSAVKDYRFPSPPSEVNLHAYNDCIYAYITSHSTLTRKINKENRLLRKALKDLPPSDARLQTIEDNINEHKLVLSASNG